jgi:hypothetical protein
LGNGMECVIYHDSIHLARENALARTIHDSLQSPPAREDEYLPRGIRGRVPGCNQQELSN